MKGYDEVLEKLLQQSTTPLNEQEAQCHTALHLAAEFSHRRCVRLLLRYNSNAFVADDVCFIALIIYKIVLTFANHAFDACLFLK